jgi:hypothetical protein
MCEQSAGDGTTFEQLKGIEDADGDHGGAQEFIDACKLIGITVAGAGRLEESHCLFNSRVIGLDPNGDNFLSVRRRPNGPSGLAYEIDQLFTNDRVCVVSANGRWLNDRYQRSGRILLGWVFDRYVKEDRNCVPVLL